MNHFIRTLFIFILLLLIYFTVCFVINKSIIAYGKLPVKNCNVLIAGDSHPLKALKPDLFFSAENIAEHGETYLISFWKLKFFLSRIKADTVILGFAHQNISKSNDEKLYAEKWSARMFQMIYPIQQFNMPRLEGITMDYKSYYKTCFKSMCLYPKFKHFTFGYENTRRIRTTDQEAVFERHYGSSTAKETSEFELAYLDSIINFLNERKIKVILIGTPVHKTYFEKIPIPIIESYNFQKTRLLSNNIDLIDKTKDFFPDSCYFNTDHLNETGAQLFTKDLISILYNRRR
jgi:hypothetical protein